MNRCPRKWSLPEWRRTLRIGRPKIDDDIRDELEFHLAMRERDHIAGGGSPHMARDAALERFGSLEDITDTLRAHDHARERFRQRKEFMQEFAQDIRYGVRKLANAPAFTFAVVVIIALGIGVNTAIFSAIDAVLLRELPFRDAQQLAVLKNVNLPTSFQLEGAARPKRSPDIHDVAAMTDVVTEWGAYAPGGLNLTDLGEPARAKIALATPSLFPMLGARPHIGRTFTDDEGKPGAPNVVVLSHELWMSRYGGDQSLVGRTISLNGTPHTVVGVMDKRFAFPSGTRLWIPLTVPFTWEGAQGEAIRAYLPSTIIVRLAQGTSVTTAGMRVRALFDPYATEKRPIKYTAAELVLPLKETFVGAKRKPLMVLMGAALLVLLTACANVVNLLLSRAASRRREFAVRAALGASRGRIIRQLLTESLLLAFLGGALGIVLAFVTTGLLRNVLPTQLIDVVVPTVDTRVLLFSLALTTITGLVFGMWPAVGASRSDRRTSASLSSGTWSTAHDGSFLRRMFVVSEMAFALILLIGAGLMMRSFHSLLTTNTGVDFEQVASAELTLPKSRYATSAARGEFFTRVLDRLHQHPGVQAAGVVNELPLRGEWGIGISATAEGKTPDPSAEPTFPQYLLVTPDYLRAMGIRLRAGRTFDATDNESQPTAIINRAMAAALWPGDDALGKRFSFGTMPGEAPSYITVIGIIDDVRSQSIENAPKPQMYLSFKDAPTDYAGIVVRGNGSDAAMLSALRDAVRAVDPQQPLYNLRMLSDVIAGTVAPRRTNTLLIVTFGVLAVVLAMIGVYAVIAYGVAQRAREIGIRMALGANRSDVLRLVLREGVVLAAIGASIGVAGAWVFSRIMESLVYGIGVRDPLTFVAAPVLLLILAVSATWLPARSATRVDPLEAIRTN